MYYQSLRRWAWWGMGSKSTTYTKIETWILYKIYREYRVSSTGCGNIYTGGRDVANVKPLNGYRLYFIILPGLCKKIL